MLSLLLIASLTLLAFTYAGYPLWIAWRARVAAIPIAECDWEPRVSVLLVVGAATDIHAQLAAKLDNLFALDYPADKLTIRVACDGHIDTAGLPAPRPGTRLVLHHFGQRRGKSARLDALLNFCDDEIVMFCDVRQRIDCHALRALLRKLADPSIGAVSGELNFEKVDAAGSGSDAYWRYEKWIRANEAASGSVIGVTGALYAARRALLPRISAGLILDDLWIPLQIAQCGARIAFADDALAFDRIFDAAHESLRKRRTLAGNFQLLARDALLRLPWRHPLGWRLFAHKWLRLAAPWLLLIALLSNALLLDANRFYRALFVAQCVLYFVAVLGLFLPARKIPRMLRLPGTFVRLNLCAALGLVDFLRNPDRGHLWPSAARSADGGRT